MTTTLAAARKALYDAAAAVCIADAAESAAYLAADLDAAAVAGVGAEAAWEHLYVAHDVWACAYDAAREADRAAREARDDRDWRALCAARAARVLA